MALRNSTRPAEPFLSANEVRFCELYAVDGNGTASVKAVWPTSSDNSAAQAARKLLRRVQIRTYIREIRDRASAAAQVSLDRVVRELARISFGRRRLAYTGDGSLKDPDFWDDELDALIAGVETVTETDGDGEVSYVRKVKFERRTEALKELSRVLGYVKDGVPLTGQTPHTTFGGSPDPAPPPADEPGS